MVVEQDKTMNFIGSLFLSGALTGNVLSHVVIWFYFLESICAAKK